MKYKLESIEDLEVLLKSVKGRDCFTFRESELRRIMYGDIYKLDETKVSQKNTVIISGMPTYGNHDGCVANYLKSILQDEYKIKMYSKVTDKSKCGTTYLTTNLISHPGNPSVQFIGFSEKQDKEIKREVATRFGAGL